MNRPSKFISTASAICLGAVFTAGVLGQAPRTAVRFDHKVRNDFFAGFGGDKEALERGMKATEQVLAGNPDHAEALVWHGAGLFSQSGEALREKDYEKGTALWSRGLAEMDRAVELQPDRVGVRIPRGAPLLAVSRFVPGDRRQELLDRAKQDYLHVYKLQQANFDALPMHSKGELLLGIADAMDRTEGFNAAKPWVERASALGDPVYAPLAKKWLAEGTLAPMSRTCKGCHVEGR